MSDKLRTTYRKLMRKVNFPCTCQNATAKWSAKSTASIDLTTALSTLVNSIPWVTYCLSLLLTARRALLIKQTHSLTCVHAMTSTRGHTQTTNWIIEQDKSPHVTQPKVPIRCCAWHAYICTSFDVQSRALCNYTHLRCLYNQPLSIYLYANTCSLSHVTVFTNWATIALQKQVNTKHQA